MQPVIEAALDRLSGEVVALALVRSYIERLESCIEGLAITCDPEYPVMPDHHARLASADAMLVYFSVDEEPPPRESHHAS